MEFTSDPFLPGPGGHAGYLNRIRRHLDRAAAVDADAALASFFGFRVPAGAFHIRGVHHVALYVGDYHREEEVEEWIDSLRGSPAVAALRSGPSYILPRHYGVPGHWMSCRVDGREVELFTARHAHPWRELDTRRKALRMSHFAVEAEQPLHVRPVLDYFAHYPGVELLSFSPGDELGHTYGHLLNRANDRVVELVYATDA
jgi:hypothetical protein